MRVKLRNWFQYRFVDQAVSRTGVLMLLLGVAVLALVAAVTGLAILFTPDEASGNPIGAAWHSLMLALDPGTIGDEAGSPAFLLLALLVTVGGILIISSLVGVLSAALNTKLETLRRGRTRVIESGHTVVLGWSEEIHNILNELRYAGERTVIVLSEHLTKQEMEEAIRARHGNTPRVICRHGDPTKAEDLELVLLDAASAIIVPRAVGADPDIKVLMTLLALNHRDWSDPDDRPPVAAVISAAANVRAARLALRGWPAGRANVVEAEDVMARLLVQSRRFPGLSVACAELLSFDGNEIRLPDRDNRAARFRAPTTYGDALLSFGTASLIGIRHLDGSLDINPPAETPITSDDTPVVIARGSGSSEVRLLPASRQPVVDQAAIHIDDTVRGARVENTLILGRNSRTERVIAVLDGYVAPGSRVDIVGEGYDPDEVFAAANLTITVHDLDPTDPGVLVGAEPDDPVDFDPTTRYHYVIVLADEEETHTDARALVTLLHVREIKDRTGAEFRIICELNDDANRRLARNIQADDLVVGQKVVSSAAVQYAKNPGRRELTEIVEELFDARGADMYFEPAQDYVALGVPVTFATVVAAAARHGETAIGYRAAADRLRDDRNFGVKLNPDKAQRRSYQPGDQIIVIAHRHVIPGRDPDEPLALVGTG